MMGQKVDANWLNNHYLVAKSVALNERQDAISHPKFVLQHRIQLDQYGYQRYYSTIDLNVS